MDKKTPKNKICFILLPGFSPDSYPMLGLKNKIEELGYPALHTNFWGPGETNLSDLTIEECKSGVSDLIKKTAENFDTVVGIGMSLGGSLLIEHSKYYSGLSYIVSIGTPFKFRNEKLINLGLMIHPLIKFFWKIARKILPNKRLFPIEASKVVVKYIQKEFLEDLEKVETPILLIHSNNDYVSDHRVLKDFFARFPNKRKGLVVLENTNHTIDYNNDLIIKHVFEFLNPIE